jgi:hypothetical protein
MLMVTIAFEEGSATLVAVTVTLDGPLTIGAVNSPSVVIFPELEIQWTAGLRTLRMEAPSWIMLPDATLGVAGVITMEAGAADCELLPSKLPQAELAKAQVTIAPNRICF